MKTTIYIFVFSLLGFHLNAQNFEQEIVNSLQSKPKFDARIDSRNSFINQSGVRVFGLKAGIQYENKISIGIGYNFLWSEINKRITNKGQLLNVDLGYYYFSPYVEYVFYEDPRWQLSIPVQFGFGESYYKNKKLEGPRFIARKFVASYEPAIAFQYRFLKYFGAGMGVGYRLMIVPNRNVEEKFTSAVYIFKLKVYFDQLMKDFGYNK